MKYKDRSIPIIEIEDEKKQTLKIKRRRGSEEIIESKMQENKDINAQ